MFAPIYLLFTVAGVIVEEELVTLHQYTSPSLPPEMIPVYSTGVGITAKVPSNSHCLYICDVKVVTIRTRDTHVQSSTTSGGTPHSEC